MKRMNEQKHTSIGSLESLKPKLSNGILTKSIGLETVEIDLNLRLESASFEGPAVSSGVGS